jgi:hypothetical protein
MAAAAAETLLTHLLLHRPRPPGALRLALGQLATQAPQPMQVAVSKADRACSAPTSMALPSAAWPVFTEQ